MATTKAPMQLLTIPETKELLRCSENHIYRLIASGELPTVDIAPQGSRQTKTRIREDALNAYLDRRSSSPKRLRAIG